MSTTFTRRHFTGLLAASGAGALSLSSKGARAQSGPIRLGLISPLSGSQEIIGRYQLAGATIAVNQINQAGGVLGRKLELVPRDDKAAPAAGVAASTASYLYTHPEVNDFFTSLAGKPHSEMQSAVKAYFSTNPEAENDLRSIRQPVVDFRERCQLPQERQP